MNPQMPRDGKDYAVVAIAVGVVISAVLWAAGALSAILAGHPVPRRHPLAGVAALTHYRDPAAAWDGPVGPAVAYWLVNLFVVVALGLVVGVGLRLIRKGKRSSKDDPTLADGLADRPQVRAHTGEQSLRARAETLRPSLVQPGPAEVGYRLGTSRGVACWASVEDSLLALGPPRSGKGQNLVIPMILDAQGAVVTTSTRPDNLTVTLAARSKRGPVAVFDPQGLASAPSLIPTMRWSPIRGCERPQTAMSRADALVTDAGKSGVENASFWRLQTVTAVRCLLHAAALDERPPADLYRWSHAPAGAKEAVGILLHHAGATPGWDRALDAIISHDPRTRDPIWAMVANAFAALADPMVLNAVTPSPGDEFDPAEFLQRNGTLYLLGTATGTSATANLVAALVEDVLDAARRIAATSARARLDPPLALVLDESANYPLPSLPALISEGGGSGITTLVVLQSLAQARDRWGREAAGAVWDSAIVKIVLGGSANADDLGAISRLIGERDVREWTESVSPRSPGKSLSMTVRRRPILEPSDIRRLKRGYGLLLLRSAPPIMMKLAPWTERPEAAELVASREAFEAAMQAAAMRPEHAQVALG